MPLLLFFLSFVMMQSAFAQNYITEKPYTDLKQIIHSIEQNHPDIKAAQEELNQTKKQHLQAKSNQRPSINASSSIYSSKIDNSNFSNGDGATTKDFSIEINQPLYRGGSTTADLNRRESLISASEMLLHQSKQNLYLEAATLYADLIRNIEIYDLRTTYETLSKRDYLSAQERHLLGELTLTDVYQAQSNYERAQALSITAASDIDITKSALSQLSKLDISHLVEPDLSTRIEQPLETMIKTAYQNNSDIIIAEYQLKAAEHQTDVTLGELYPQLFAFANYNKQYDPQPGIVDNFSSGTIGLRANINLYQGGNTRARIQESKHVGKELEHRIASLKQDIEQIVIANKLAYDAALQTVQNHRRLIASVGRALDGIRTEAQLGQRAFIDVLDANEDMIEAKISFSTIKHRAHIARFQLWHSLGLLEQNIKQ